MNLHRTRCIVLVLCVASFSMASELSDSMELFFNGNYQDAHQRLTALIEAGSTDARLFYFRGLASHRLGKIEPARQDFRHGARLEISGRGATVGHALQRVQGRERLLLEKYRTMARLAARHRSQSVAPKPPTASTGEPVSIQLANAESEGPRFRLASEVPLRATANQDPLDHEIASLIANEQQPVAPAVTSDGQESSVAVGTGVAGAATTAPVVEDTSEPFDPFTIDLPQPQVQANGGNSGGRVGVIGAVFRALRRAAIPQLDAQSLLPPGVLPVGRPEEATIRYDPSDDPFGDSAFGDDVFDDGSLSPVPDQDDLFDDLEP